MPTTLVQLTVFVSGPSDTDVEKSALRRTIAELSRMLERTHAITLQAIGWPDDIRPGVSGDPQAQINSQIGHSYDIYVGILGPRFGTPTPRAPSGTQEEFEAAVARFHENSTSVRVLFYFKRAGSDPFAIDITQLQKVKTFRDGLGERGVLYRDFSETADFVDMAKDHLHSLIAKEWQNGAWVEVLGSDGRQADGSPKNDAMQKDVTVASVCDNNAPSSEIDTETELGMLDYMNAFHEAVGPLGEALLQISRHTEEMTQQINARTAETTALQEQHQRERHIGGNRAQQQYVANAVKVVNRAAKTLNEYADALSTDLEHFRTHNRAVFINLDRGAAEGGSNPETDKENAEALDALIIGLQTTRSHISTYDGVLRKMPGLTGELKRARRRVATHLGDLIAELSFSISKAETLLRRLRAEPPFLESNGIDECRGEEVRR